MTRSREAGASIQARLLPHTGCFGCGSENALGLRLRSYPADGTVQAVFTGLPQHGNGMGSLNGGIISTVLDCHSAAAATHEADVRGWSDPADRPRFVTAALDVRFLRPAPVGEVLQVRASVADPGPDQMIVDAELVLDGKQRATATARLVRRRPRQTRPTGHGPREPR